MRLPLYRSKRFALLWCLLLLFFVLATDPPDPLEAPIWPDAIPHPPVVAGWIIGPRGETRPMVVTLASHMEVYSEVSAFSYSIERDGSLTANAPVSDTITMDFARLNGIKVIPTVASTWESSSITRILKDPGLRADHINAIMQIARLPMVDGIDLDYENLPPDAKQVYTEFITTLAALLHREGRTLSITVPAKTSDDDACVICKFADYAALGAAADQIRVMAYEYHGKSGGPAPNAPLWWVRQVMEYTVTRVPRHKAVLGIHLYAYDWGGRETPAYWWNEVQRRKQLYLSDETYVESDARGIVGESMLQYVIPSPPCPRYEPDCERRPPEFHTVWFVDHKYVALAWDIVKDLQLGGIVMWRPGGEDPAIWDVIDGEGNQNQ